MKQQKYQETANQILFLVGGKDNVVRVASCATRLRIVVCEDQKIDVEQIESLDLVKGTFNNGGQFQIILGTGIVDQVYQEFLKQSGIQEMGKEELKEVAGTKMNVFQRMLKSLADVFVPILPALVAAGLLMGLNNVLTAQGLFIEGKSLIESYPQMADLAEMINLFSNAAFTFLPVLIAASSNA